MLPDSKIKCPYTAFKMRCLDGVVKHKCPKWVHVIGRNPQTGDKMDNYACADTLMPLLLIENAQMQRQTAAAVEDFRNNMVALNKPVSLGPQMGHAPLYAFPPNRVIDNG